MAKRPKISLVVHLTFDGLSRAKRAELQLKIAKLGATKVTLEDEIETTIDRAYALKVPLEE